MVNTCFTGEGNRGSLYGQNGTLCAVRGYDEEAQNLVCLLDGNWGSFIDRSSYLGCHFGFLEYGSEYVSAELWPGFSRPVNMFYGKSAVAEWKWMLSRQKVSVCNSATKEKFEENMDIFLDTDVKKDAMKIAAEFSSISIGYAPSKTEGCPCAGIRKPQRLHMIPSTASNVPVLSHKNPLWHTAKGHACIENSYMCPMTRPRDESSKWFGYCRSDWPSLRSSLTWTEGWVANGHVTSSRSADDSCSPPSLDLLYLSASLCEGESSALENIPPSLDQLCLAASLGEGESSALENTPPSVDQLCLAASLREDEPSALENTLSSMSTMGISHSMPPCGCPSGVTKPSVVQSVPLQLSTQDSLKDEKTTWKASNEECFDATIQEYEILGKALCHAQTRARLAERRAARVIQETEMLEQLLLREVWTTFTYRQRAQTLELENRLLKMCSEIKVEMRMGVETLNQCGLVEQRARISRKLAQKRCPCQNKTSARVSCSCQDKECNFSRSQSRSVLLSCVLGLAFVLGMGFAGAGFMIGWSMSRMLFS